MTLQSMMHVQTNRDGVVSRRSFLRHVAAGAAEEDRAPYSPAHLWSCTTLP